jgi:Papain family cysteine protease
VTIIASVDSERSEPPLTSPVMNDRAFEYEESLLLSCATSELVARVVAGLKVATDNGSTEACRMLQNMFWDHYGQLLAKAPRSDWNERFLFSVYFVHRHNTSNGKTHTVTLNQFAVMEAVLSGWEDVDSANDDRVMSLHDKDSIQRAARMISTTSHDNERHLRRRHHNHHHRHHHRNSIALHEDTNAWKALKLENTHQFSGQQVHVHSRPIGQILEDDSTQALDDDDLFATSLNWATTNNPDGVPVVHPAADQGICGSCWAWAATGTLEASATRRRAYQAYQASIQKGHHDVILEAQHTERASLTLADLSVQELVDCDTAIDDGCIGGNPLLAFYYIHRYGLSSSSAYPYLGKENLCRRSNQKPIAAVEAWGLLTSNHEDNMEMVLRDIGPVAVGLNGADPTFLAYKGGVFDLSDCDQLANHAMLIVGYGQDERDDGTPVKFWIARNSWGRGWGEDGYVRIKRGSGGKAVPGVCGIASNPSVALGGVLLTGKREGIDYEYDRNPDGSKNQSVEKRVFFNQCDALHGFEMMQACHEIAG